MKKPRLGSKLLTYKPLFFPLSQPAKKLRIQTGDDKAGMQSISIQKCNQFLHINFVSCNCAKLIEFQENPLILYMSSLPRRALPRVAHLYDCTSVQCLNVSQLKCCSAPGTLSDPYISSSCASLHAALVLIFPLSPRMPDNQESKGDEHGSVRKLSETPARTQTLKQLPLFRGHSPDETIRVGCCFQRSAD